MTKVCIKLELDDECADPEDRTGLTEEAYQELMCSLNEFGHDISVERID